MANCNICGAKNAPHQRVEGTLGVEYDLCDDCTGEPWRELQVETAAYLYAGGE